MTKLKLDVDELRVATFEPAADAAAPRGTVAAHEAATTTCPTWPLLQCPHSAFPTCGIYC